MWGREPRRVLLLRQDRKELERIVGDGRTAQRVARRGRILLAMAQPEATVEETAEHLEVERTTVWRVCRRYEAQGLSALSEAPRSGRPREISPPGAGANRTIGVL